MNEKCINCSEHKNCKDSFASWVFLIVGMVATIALRVVTVLAHMNPIYGQLAWYVGVIGFFIFFIYKFKIEQQRYQLIVKKGLMHRITAGQDITPGDRQLISSVLCSLSSNKDKLNYLLIFVSSAIALGAAVYFDFIKYFLK